MIVGVTPNAWPPNAWRPRRSPRRRPWPRPLCATSSRVEAIRCPAFNIADSCICVAAGLLILGVFREPGKTDEADKSPAAAS